MFLFPILIMFFPYETGWNFVTLEYHGFWTIDGFIRNLFINGFNPVFPWFSFILLGLWFGKQDLNDKSFLKKTFWYSLTSFVLINLLSYSLINISTEVDAQELTELFGTGPMPPLPIFMINGMSIALATISACIIVSAKFNANFVIQSLHKTGKLALTFYVAHVVLGMGLIDELFTKELGSYSIEFSVAYSIIFCLSCIIFTLIWNKFYTLGPLELVMRKLTD